MDKISYWGRRTAKNSQGAIYAHHSGDITDGTGGAWEYIDIEARKALKAEVCYLVPVVQLYSGFGEAHTLAAVNDLQAGFMVVPAVGVGEVHEVSQVHTKFTLRALRAAACCRCSSWTCRTATRTTSPMRLTLS